MSISEQSMRRERNGKLVSVTMKAAYPFDSLKPGDAFLVRDARKENSLRAQASRKNKNLVDSRFVVIRDAAGIVVGRAKITPDGRRVPGKLRVVETI